MGRPPLRRMLSWRHRVVELTAPPAAASLEDATLDRLVDLLYARRRLAILTFPFVALLFVRIEWRQAPESVLLIWAATVVAAMLAGILLHDWYRKGTHDAPAMRRWAKRATMSSFLNGCVLGSAGFFLFPPDAVHQVFLLLMLGGMSSTAIASTSSYLPAYDAFVVPILLPAVIRLVQAGDALHGAMAVLVLLHGGFMIGLARVGHRTLVEATTLSFKNRVLVEDLSRASRELERLVADRTAELERARTALRLSEEQFRQAQKLEALGRLAGGVAHDFNNALAVILGYTELLLDAPGREPAEEKKLVAIRDSAEHAAAFTRQLLAFSRRNVFQPRVVELSAVVRDAEQMMRGVVGEEVELEMKLDPVAGPVKVESDQMVQVLMNLASNARDAIAGHGRLSVEVAPANLTAEFTSDYPDARPGPHVLFAVRDTGCGMDAATKARLFEPFFTTKGMGKGTGLGLSNVYAIVRQSGGFIVVESAPGRGTTVRIYLPVSADAATPVPAVRAPTTREAAGGTVLLVEDEALVRAMVRDALTAAGFTLLVADGPDQALALSGRHAGAISLMVTDMRMPGMTGLELARVLADQRPRMRVLFMSGYFDRETDRDTLHAIDGRFLQKPFMPSDLVRKVDEVLAAA